MGEIFTAVFIIMAGEQLTGITDPRHEIDYHRCMIGVASHAKTSIEWTQRDRFCAAIAALDPSTLT